MARTTGCYEYGDEVKALVLSLITDKPITRNSITKELNKIPIYHNIHYYTIGRLLTELEKENKIKKIQMNRMNLWYRNEVTKIVKQ